MLPSFHLGGLLPLVWTGISVAVLLDATQGPDDVFAAIALQNVYKVLNGTIQDGSNHARCTKDKLVVRKE